MSAHGSNDHTYAQRAAELFVEGRRQGRLVGIEECIQKLVARGLSHTCDDIRALKDLRTGEGPCDHRFESNPGMYDTSHRYCAKCGRAE